MLQKSFVHSVLHNEHFAIFSSSFKVVIFPWYFYQRNFHTSYLLVTFAICNKLYLICHGYTKVHPNYSGDPNSRLARCWNGPIYKLHLNTDKGSQIHMTIWILDPFSVGLQWLLTIWISEIKKSGIQMFQITEYPCNCLVVESPTVLTFCSNHYVFNSVVIFCARPGNTKQGKV